MPGIGYDGAANVDGAPACRAGALLTLRIAKAGILGLRTLPSCLHDDVGGGLSESGASNTYGGARSGVGTEITAPKPGHFRTAEQEIQRPWIFQLDGSSAEVQDAAGDDPNRVADDAWIGAGLADTAELATTTRALAPAGRRRSATATMEDLMDFTA
ncbi:MAG TPA: hypothetical protein VEL28_14745 [Candidatus Binatia bacterium]|nr:hypothetical protein [Candidatus Binatia bacterium]